MNGILLQAEVETFNQLNFGSIYEYEYESR